MMKTRMHKFLAVFFSLALLLAFAGTAVAADTVITMQLGSPSMTINGTSRPIDADGTMPTTINGRTMLPLRAIAEALGLEVDWNGADQTITLRSNDNGTADTQSGQPTEQATEQGNKALVVYFSMPETTSPDNMTTEEDNSVVVIDGQVLGNTQYMAQVIQQTIGGDIFRIEPATSYPTDHSTLVSLAAEEQDNNARPAIAAQIENFADYDTVFIGYPIWWSDMPMILYTFFDEYDFSGKTIIPFSTHGGSSFAGTPATIQQLEPNANMLEGLTISRNDIQEAEQEIVSWVNSLELK